jgi:hypothetical protein
VVDDFDVVLVRALHVRGVLAGALPDAFTVFAVAV